jgi:aspartyl-tRNA(Asn)/glutamyl-tRNA(Gln) amidotransferase subunit B
LCTKVLEANRGNVAAYRNGKTTLLGFFVGQVMKQTAGRADAQRVGDIFKELLDRAERP